MAFDAGTPAPLRRTSERTLLETYHFDVRRLVLEGPSGSVSRDIEVHPGTVAVLAETVDGRVAMVHQYRVPLDRWTLEIPAGRTEPGEDPRTSAERELAEEAGLRAGRIEEMARFVNAPGHSTQETIVYHATSCVDIGRRPVGPEEATSTMELLTLDEALDLVDERVICDAKSCVALLTLSRKGARCVG